MWIKKTQNIIETFDDDSPKLIHITKNILGNKYLIRTLEFWENGEMRYDKHYKNGRPEGKQLFFSEQGEKTEQWIINGKRDRIYSQWDKNGKLIVQEKWKNGKRIKIIYNSKNQN